MQTLQKDVSTIYAVKNSTTSLNYQLLHIPNVILHTFQDFLITS